MSTIQLVENEKRLNKDSKSKSMSFSNAERTFGLCYSFVDKVSYMDLNGCIFFCRDRCYCAIGCITDCCWKSSSIEMQVSC